MKFLLSLSVIILLFQIYQVPTKLAKASHKLKNKCYLSLPKSEQLEVHAALVCGTSLQNTEKIKSLRQTGLIHLIVVSGSHLTFLSSMTALLLSKIIRNNIIAEILIFTLLIAFTLITGLEPPCTRSLAHFVLTKANKKYHLFWSSHNEVMFSGFITLFFFPNWINSLSFFLSWICALTLSIKTESSFYKSLLIYLGVLPALSSFGSPHPFSIIMNLIFTPIIGTIVFPLAIAASFFECLNIVFNIFWEFLFQFLDICSRFMPTLATLPIPLRWLWLSLLIFHFFLHLKTVYRAQND